jgi:mannosyl-3-phosphoglycerate phosphatase
MTGVNFKLIVFSDIDGTLIDRKTFSPGPSVKALSLCREKNIPVVLVSGKTRCEMEKLRRELEIDAPFISENGGGMYIPDGFFGDAPGFHRAGPYKCICSRESIQVLRKFLHDTGTVHNIQIRSFEQLSVAEVSDLTGLDTECARLAGRREFDEPFVVIDETAEKIGIIKAAIERSAFRYNFGGSLHHITGNFDKGGRVLELMKLFRAADPGVKFAAIGDAYNDLPMLKNADHAFWVGMPEAAPAASDFPGEFIITASRGPQGFAQAIGILIEKLGS